MKTTLSLPQELIDALDRAARAKRVSRSALVESAIEAWLKSERRRLAKRVNRVLKRAGSAQAASW